ncbi:hypothetical protein [Nonomuraea wenchangensis]|nr:hypothetical protein [Nonomuraea wenchangensis]
MMRPTSSVQRSRPPRAAHAASRAFLPTALRPACLPPPRPFTAGVFFAWALTNLPHYDFTQALIGTLVLAAVVILVAVGIWRSTRR